MFCEYGVIKLLQYNMFLYFGKEGGVSYIKWSTNYTRARFFFFLFHNFMSHEIFLFCFVFLCLFIFLHWGEKTMARNKQNIELHI